jgi:hypothetical protein
MGSNPTCSVLWTRSGLAAEVSLTMSGADQFLDLVIISQGGCG